MYGSWSKNWVATCSAMDHNQKLQSPILLQGCREGQVSVWSTFGRWRLPSCVAQRKKIYFASGMQAKLCMAAIITGTTTSLAGWSGINCRIHCRSSGLTSTWPKSLIKHNGIQNTSPVCFRRVDNLGREKLWRGVASDGKLRLVVWSPCWINLGFSIVIKCC